MNIGWFGMILVSYCQSNFFIQLSFLYKIFIKMKSNLIKWFLIIQVIFPLLINAQSEEFYGAFKSWTNLKDVYHAKGNGVDDDTKAIQTAMNELGQNNHSPVLYFPKGTYIISSTLTMQTMMDITIVGEDPETTIIKWNGKDGQKMFLLNGVSYSQYMRLTWDGNNKAAVGVAHEWDGKVRYANSGTEHADEIFRNMGTGLKSGANMDAEFSIRRCRFYNCSSTGISLQGWNALDWWIWDCYFENCNAGVANNLPANGAGNFHVYRSIFKNSALADISLGNSEYYSLRNNISYHSKYFIKTFQGTNTSPITIQNNIIISENSMAPSADIFTKGNVLFLDNTFITPDSNKNFVIEDDDNWNNVLPDITIIGNSFTATKKIIQVWGNHILDIDNKYGIAKPTFPNLKPKPFSPLIKYPVYELDNKMSVDEMQAVINKAATAHKKSLVHFAFGVYNISKSLIVPAGAQLIFYGDGLSSYIKWAGQDGESVIVVNYPAKCVLKSLKINGNAKVDGIKIYDNDETGNTIYANELIAYGGTQTNVFIIGFSNTNIRFEDFQHNYCTKGNSLKFIGNDKPDANILKVFGCVSADNKNSYSVNNGSRILVYDAWFEDGEGSQFLSLKNNGEFYLNGAKIANTNATKIPFVNIDSFSGKAVLAQIIYNEPHKSIYFSTVFGKAKLLTLGTLNWSDSTTNVYNMKADTNSFAHINNRYNIGKGSYSLPNLGNTNNAFIKEMLSAIRSTSVAEKINSSTKNAHLTIDRVMIENGVNDVHIEKISPQH
jgi:hypothetical protein